MLEENGRDITVPQENQSGEFFSFSIDWDKGAMRFQEAHASQKEGLGELVYALPLLRALEDLVKRGGRGNPPFRFRIDALYDRETLTLSVHPTEDFHSVVEVPRELLRELLREVLTPRETEAAIFLFEGCTIRYIAVQMKIAEGTVKRMIYNIYKKMNLASQVELIRDIYARLAQHASMQEARD